MVLTLTFAPIAACNNLLEVENPGRIPIEALDDPFLAPSLAAGAIQTLQCGATAFAATGGMLSGEYLSANGFVNNHPWEWRGVVEIKNEPGSCNSNATPGLGLGPVLGRNSTFMGF